MTSDKDTTKTSKDQKMQESQQTENQSEQPTSGLSINDLQMIKNIIDVACQRGAIKPNEMVAVGNTYTKLEQFLASVQQTEQQ